MTTYTFHRTMQYTEVVEVEADSYDDARELAEGADGERNNDDAVVEMILTALTN